LRAVTDISGIEALIDEHEAALIRYASGMLRDGDAARDMVQDAFIRLIRHRQKDGAPIRNMQAWLFRVVHNLCLDYIRKHKRQLPLTEEGENHLADRASQEPDRALESSEAAAIAVETLGILSQRDRQVVVMKIMENLSYKEIAERLGLTIGNVGFILHNSLKKLARELKKVLT